MKLKNVQITNFRCFEFLSLDLDEQLTVLVAKNGQGKTSSLDAIRKGLWSFIKGFDLAHNPASDSDNNISIDDVRIAKMPDGQMARQLPCEITLEGNLNIKIHSKTFIDICRWTIYRDNEAEKSKSKSDSNTNQLTNFASDIQTNIRDPKCPNINMPVFGYYGTGRGLSQKKLTKNKTAKKDNNVYMRLFAYRDCTHPASSYKYFEDWFTWIWECYWEERIKQQDNKLPADINSQWKETILVVQQAINSVLESETGWRDLEYSISDEKSLILNHPEYGKLKVAQLSDGIRNTLAMVADIAYRCVKLNWHLGINAAKKSEGIVLIDEIDMHLHPAWQQTVLNNLCKAFPKIQFIVTTHSPQVLSSVPSHQIRVLDNGKVYPVEAGTQGAEASRILQEIFVVELRPQHLDIVKKLNAYQKLIDEDKWDSEEALTLRQELEEWNKSELIKADIDIRMKEFQRQL